MLTKSARAQDTMTVDGNGMAMDNGAMMGGTMMAPGAMGANPFGDLANFKTDADILNFALILEYSGSRFLHARG